jgi:predicted nucleotidyltransferase
VELTGREVHRLAGHGSEQGVRRAADRLVEQGLVLRRKTGAGHLYRLNEEHLGADAVRALATLRERLIERLRAQVEGWRVAPVTALLFGSAARGEAGTRSDIDLMAIRPAGRDAEDEVWRDQLAELERRASAWAGNDARVLEYAADELAELSDEEVLHAALSEGIELYGTRRALRRAMGLGRG